MTMSHIWLLIQIAVGIVLLAFMTWRLVVYIKTGRDPSARPKAKIKIVRDPSELPPELANQVSDDNSIRASSKEEAIEMLRRKDPKLAKQMEKELRKRGQF